MFAVLLLTTLLAAADPQADQAPTPQPEDLAQAGNYKAALEGFRRRVAADPGDLDARVWIAWLHERMGRPDLAEPVYRSVVLEAPGHVDAAIRLATLLTKQRHDERGGARVGAREGCRAQESGSACGARQRIPGRVERQAGACLSRTGGRSVTHTRERQRAQARATRAPELVATFRRRRQHGQLRLGTLGEGTC